MTSIDMILEAQRAERGKAHARSVHATLTLGLRAGMDKWRLEEILMLGHLAAVAGVQPAELKELLGATMADVKANGGPA